MGFTVPGFNFVVMSPADQISLMTRSSMTIPKITTLPMAHPSHDRPLSEPYSIHLRLDPKTEPLSQQTPPSYNRENGELFLLLKLFNV